MIELAPNHKSGLAIANPVLLAAGSAGMGDAVPGDVKLASLGGIVVGPLTRRSRGGSDVPRIAEVLGGFVLDTGMQNRGLDATLRHHAESWARMPVPVIVQVAESDYGILANMERRLSATEGVVGMEWLPDARLELRAAQATMEMLREISDLPVIVKLPVARALEWASAIVAAGASALVVGASPEAAAWRDGNLVSGSLYGPVVFPIMLRALCDVAALELGVPLVAAGGIHTVEQARQAMTAGATAFQLDAVVWLEPPTVNEIVDALA